MLTGKKVLVIGLARSGNAAVHLLQKLNATITINEGKNKEDIKEYDEYVSQGIEMVTGGHPDELFDLLFPHPVNTPAMHITLIASAAAFFKLCFLIIASSSFFLSLFLSTMLIYKKSCEIYYHIFLK